MLTLYEASGDRVGAACVLAHGAGAGQRSPFMVTMATELAARGIDVATFDFPYMTRGRGAPDRAPVLEASYLDAIAEARRQLTTASRHLFIGGKSMGGRIATHVAAAHHDPGLSGLLVLGYPLHPPGAPAKRRDAHLPLIHQPMLIVQGERDTFGTPDEFASVLETMNPRPVLHVIPKGDHSFKAGRTPPALPAIADTMASWVRKVLTH